MFGDVDAVITDAIWVSRERWALIARETGHLHGAPELVVEVLSPGATNERRDREAKLKLYTRRGVDEYWIVDWEQRLVEVYRRDGEDLPLATTLHQDDRLRSPLLPGFDLPVSGLFFPEDY